MSWGRARAQDCDVQVASGCRRTSLKQRLFVSILGLGLTWSKARNLGTYACLLKTYSERARVPAKSVTDPYCVDEKGCYQSADDGLNRPLSRHLERGQLTQHQRWTSRTAAATSWQPPPSVLSAVPE